MNAFRAWSAITADDTKRSTEQPPSRTIWARGEDGLAIPLDPTQQLEPGTPASWRTSSEAS